MKYPTIFKFSFITEILITIFIPPKIITNPAIITYQYGLPFGYFNIYTKKVVDNHIIYRMFQGNDGIHIEIFALIINLILIYLLFCFLNYIFKKLHT